MSISLHSSHCMGVGHCNMSYMYFVEDNIFPKVALLDYPWDVGFFHGGNPLRPELGYARSRRAGSSLGWGSKSQDENNRGTRSLLLRTREPGRQ